ncbi:MAG: GIY-YIG nuclease family protein, partial [Gammaproteobacteria bacterium]|nr:GIY-YIG nuclease family protein [Gammaproteobacteria bacterium]
MAIDNKLWIQAKNLYEKGLSTRDISKEIGIEHTTIYKKSKQQKWAREETKDTTYSGTVRSGYIYLITTEKDEQLYKIGLAVDVKSRMKAMQSGNPHKLILKGCYFVKNMYVEEKYWH